TVEGHPRLVSVRPLVRPPKHARYWHDSPQNAITVKLRPENVTVWPPTLAYFAVNVWVPGLRFTTSTAAKVPPVRCEPEEPTTSTPCISPRPRNIVGGKLVAPLTSKLIWAPPMLDRFMGLLSSVAEMITNALPASVISTPEMTGPPEDPSPKLLELVRVCPLAWALWMRSASTAADTRRPMSVCMLAMASSAAPEP